MTVTKKTRKKPPTYKVAKRGSSFQTTITHDNVRKRPTFATDTEAHAWGAEQVTRLLQGLPMVDPNTHIPRRNADDDESEFKPVTLAELYKVTCDEHWNKKQSRRTLTAGAKDCLKIFGEKCNFRSLTRPQIINKLEAYRQQRGNQISTTNRRISALQMMFHYGEMYWQGWKAPILEKDDEHNQRTFRVPPSLEEAMLRWFINRNDILMYDICVIALYCGQRLGELLRLRLDESTAHPLDGYIDTATNCAYFPKQKARNKSTRSHFVPLRPIVQEVIDRRRAEASAPNDRIFPDDFNVTKIDHEWNKMRTDLIQQGNTDIINQKKEHQKVGQEFVPHILRHELCSRLGDAGFWLHEIKQYSGHASDSMVERYVKDNRVALRERALREGTLKERDLPGGEVPSYSPTLLNNVIKLEQRPRRAKKAAPAQPTAVADNKAEALRALLEANGFSMADLIASAGGGKVD